MNKCQMKILFAVLLVFCHATIAFAQAESRGQLDSPKKAVASGFRAEILDEVDSAGRKIIALAEITPPEKFSWRPAAGIRSFGEVYMHIAAGNFFVLSYADIKQPADISDVENMEKITDKAKTLTLLKRSFEHLHQSVLNAKDSDLDKPAAVKLLGEKSTLRGVFLRLGIHVNEHLGQAVAYARMNGIVPPWSVRTANLEDPPWIKEIAPKRIVYSVPGMEQVKVQKNLTYKTVADTELKADVYSPLNSQNGERRPAVVFIHGGALPPNLLTKPKEWGVYASYGQLLAASGFVGVTFNHRYYGWDYLDEAQTDVDDLIAYIRNNADSLGIDKEKIFVWGFSAGGIFLNSALRDAPAYIRGIVAYYPILDLRPMRKDIPAAVPDETLKAFSPLYHLSVKGKTVAPIFVARAGLDDSVLNGAVDSFAAEAKSKNVKLTLSNHAAGQHGFDALDDNERSREIIKQTVAFIKMHS